MEKTHRLVVTIGLVILIGFSGVSVQAEKKDGLKNKSPDYSKEYVGEDRLESFNRMMFGMNMFLNNYIVYPVNATWASIMPKYGIERIDTVFENLAYPKRLTGCLFQADVKCTGTETVRFVTNTTLGLGGMYDPAESWFNVEPRKENIAQAFEKWGIGRGYYLYLPFVGPTNVRNGIGTILETPLNPETYFPYPVVVFSIKGARVLNKSTEFQKGIDYINDTYADPYEITKQFYGLSTYFYEQDLDRKEVFEKKDKLINPVSEEETKPCTIDKDCPISNVRFKNFESQGSVVDAMRTAVFDRQPEEESMWLDISLWNKSFKNRFKSDSVRISETAPKYKYRYIMQDNENSPIAIIYPSIGENVQSAQATALAKIIYEQGYSILLMSNVFDWKFVRSMPGSYKPGITSSDAMHLRFTTAKILDRIIDKHDCEFREKIVVGTSLGAMHTLFMASQEETENLLGISRYICISPPVDILYAVNTIDSFIASWKDTDSETLKLKTALAASKIRDACGKKYDCHENIIMPFNESEAKLVVSFIAKQKLSDLIITLEKDSGLDKDELYDEIFKMDFNDYLNKYFLADPGKNIDSLDYAVNLYELEDFLKSSPNIHVFASKDDYLLSPEHVQWLKNTAKGKITIFSNGSHMGFLYRQEFQDKFIKEISPQL